jgi:hypothetical protein
MVCAAQVMRCQQIRFGSGLLGAIALLAAGGCAVPPYRYGGDYRTELDVPLKDGEAQVERGRRAPVIDAVGWVIGIPSKVVMLDHRVNNHDVSPETEAAIHEYLAANDPDKVKVRVNEYDPGGEWGRLVRNKSVGWPLRYTFGTLSCLGYTLLPGRVFGGDRYNPFTNTINIYSDVPALALYEGGHAKDFAQKEYKGLYAVAHGIPVVGMWHGAQASADAIGYLQANGTTEQIKEGYRSMRPAYAIDMSNSLSGLTGASAPSRLSFRV